MPSFSVYGLKLSVLKGMGGKALATDHRVHGFQPRVQDPSSREEGRPWKGGCSD